MEVLRFLCEHHVLWLQIMFDGKILDKEDLPVSSTSLQLYQHTLLATIPQVPRTIGIPILAKQQLPTAKQERRRTGNDRRYRRSLRPLSKTGARPFRQPPNQRKAAAGAGVMSLPAVPPVAAVEPVTVPLPAAIGA